MLTVSSVWLAPIVPVILDESPKLAHHLPLCISASESAHARAGERERDGAQFTQTHESRPRRRDEAHGTIGG
jgi:hypothetical protein